VTQNGTLNARGGNGSSGSGGIGAGTYYTNAYPFAVSYQGTVIAVH